MANSKPSFELFNATTNAGAKVYKLLGGRVKSDEILRELLLEQGVLPQNLATLERMGAILVTREVILKKAGWQKPLT